MREKKIEVIMAVCMSIAIVFTLTMAYFPGVLALEQRGMTKKYETSLFDKTSLMTVDISMEEEVWEEMLEKAADEEYYSCDITINGTTYQNVGIRPKGNTSLSQIVSDDTTDRFSFKVEFDHYLSGQTCDGLDKLCLNNLMSDATYMKEYISYDILNYMGVPSSLYTFAEITVNGEPWGLYLALETVEESFAERNFGVSYGKLYKPETNGMGGEKGGMNSGGADLSYIDDEISSYSTIFDSAVFSASKSDYKRVIDALKHISAGEELENYMDVDEMLRYIAANTFLLNDDSYFGTMLHNYYLYEKDGKLSMLPWDYNLAFGGFLSGNATELVNRGIDDVVAEGTSLEARPMIGKVLENEEYREQYYQYLDDLIRGYFESGQFETTIDMLRELIDEAVQNDVTAFYTYEEYLTAQENFVNLCMLRAESVRGQLEGVIPSASEKQEANSDARIDASSVNIQAMGSQGGGGHDQMREMGRWSSDENSSADSSLKQTEEEAIDLFQKEETIKEVSDEINEEMSDGTAANEGSGDEENIGSMEESPRQNEVQGENQMQSELQDMTSGDFQQMGEDGMGWEPGDMGQRGGRIGGMNAPDMQQDTQTDPISAYIWIGVSFAVILAGLGSVCLYPRRRY